MRLFVWFLPILLVLAPACACADEDEEDVVLAPAERRQLSRILGGDQVPYNNGLDDLISATDVNDLDSISTVRLFQGDASEKQRLRAVALERNARALELARRGLSRGIARRASTRDDLSVDIYLNARLRTLARLFALEGDYYAFESDNQRALDAYLNGIELGVVTPSGGTWGSFLGASYGSVERAAIKRLASRLNVLELRDSALRLRQIERRRPSTLSLWRASKQVALAELRENWPTFTPRNLRENFGLSPGQAREVKRLTREQMLFQANERYSDIMRRTKWLFARRVREPLPASNPLLEKFYPIAGLKIEQIYHFVSARNLLLADALELRAIYLETDAYPETFAAAADPFGDDARLIYRRAGESYALYSIGPNGVDDGGVPIEGKTSELLVSGDIIAPVL